MKALKRLITGLKASQVISSTSDTEHQEKLKNMLDNMDLIVFTEGQQWYNDEVDRLWKLMCYEMYDLYNLDNINIEDFVDLKYTDTELKELVIQQLKGE